MKSNTFKKTKVKNKQKINKGEVWFSQGETQFKFQKTKRES